MFRILKKAWIPLLLVVVVAVGVYAVVRIRDTLGAHAATAAVGNGDNTTPFNPKHITYEITGSGGSVNVITSTKTVSPIVSMLPLCRGRSPS